MSRYAPQSRHTVSFGSHPADESLAVLLRCAPSAVSAALRGVATRDLAFVGVVVPNKDRLEHLRLYL
eukprot:315445-Prymnesium_polylepis.1